MGYLSISWVAGNGEPRILIQLTEHFLILRVQESLSTDNWTEFEYDKNQR